MIFAKSHVLESQVLSKSDNKTIFLLWYKQMQECLLNTILMMFSNKNNNLQ